MNNAFNSKNACDGRAYEYIVPTYAFAPRSNSDNNQEYKFTEELRQNINSVLSIYNGTHNYHNFTLGKVPSQENAKRFIVSFKVS